MQCLKVFTIYSRGGYSAQQWRCLCPIVRCSPALAPNLNFLLVQILKTVIIRFLLPIWETWMELTAPGFSLGPGPAVLDILAMNVWMRTLLLPLRFKKKNWVKVYLANGSTLEYRESSFWLLAYILLEGKSANYIIMLLQSSILILSLQHPAKITFSS